VAAQGSPQAGRLGGWRSLFAAPLRITMPEVIAAGDPAEVVDPCLTPVGGVPFGGDADETSLDSEVSADGRPGRGGSARNLHMARGARSGVWSAGALLALVTGSSLRWRSIPDELPDPLVPPPLRSVTAVKVEFGAAEVKRWEPDWVGEVEIVEDADLAGSLLNFGCGLATAPPPRGSDRLQ
jgi:hypothetical protein